MSAARSPAHRPAHVPQQAWEKIAAFAFGVMFIAALLVLAIAFPQPTPFQYDVFRIVLAIASGGVAAVIPGFLAVSMDAKGLVIRAGGALAVFLLVYFFSPAQLVSSTSSPVSQPHVTATDRSIAAGGAITATAQPGGMAIVTTGNVILDAKAIAESLLKAHEERELAGFREREQAYQDHVKALTNTVTALVQQQHQPNAPPGIEDAFAQLQQGHTAAAETIFETVLARKAAEGQAANQQAAAAARHLGALASLHDTAKALTAYRRAVALNPANAEGWNGLGHLLYRIGHLDEAIAAYNHMLALGTISGDQDILAAACGNLGVMYQGRGDLTQAEAMHRKALELSEALGHKESIATAYSNLGIVYQGRGDLTQAEAMYHKALELSKTLGRKQLMANAYINLGNVYRRREDLTQAEAMYHKALELSEALADKEGLARASGNLGTINLIRGDLRQAEVMYHKALELSGSLDYKESIAIAYLNLGGLYEGGGNLTQAETMYRQALTRFQELGATSRIETVRTSLERVRRQCLPFGFSLHLRW